MAKDLKDMSTERLTKRIKAATIVMSVCWAAVIISTSITLFYGKSPFVFASSVGFLSLFVASMAMLTGIKKAGEGLARRNR